jgi:hypothetical protein
MEVGVRTVFSAVWIAVLSVALVEAPVLAAPASSPSAALGVVLSAENAHVGAGVISSGETIYDGDRLQTPPDGTLRVRLGAGQLFLRQSSEAEVHALANGFWAQLSSGSVVVSSGEGQSFELVADGATIRPANAQPASGQITVITPKELVLTSTRGMLTVSMGDEVKTVEAGNSYRMEVETEDSGPGPQGGPARAGRNRFLLILIPAVAVVTGILIWRALISPDAPGDQ